MAELVDRLFEESGSATSDRFINAVVKAGELLALMPGAGSVRNYSPEFSDSRIWPVPEFRKYLIFHRANDTDLEIVCVLHGAQNLDAVFAPPVEQ